MAESVDEQPGGSPENEYDNGPVPPATETASVVSSPTLMVELDVAKETRDGSGLTVRVREDDALSPTLSVTVAVRENEPLVEKLQVREFMLVDEHSGGSSWYE